VKTNRYSLVRSRHVRHWATIKHGTNPAASSTRGQGMRVWIKPADAEIYVAVQRYIRDVFGMSGAFDEPCQDDFPLPFSPVMTFRMPN
jgi:hypothetical protein